VVDSLCAATQSDHTQYKHIRDWLRALDRADAANFPQGVLAKAIEVKDKLLKSGESEFVLHGDLHHDNILSHGDAWLAIDPKGVVGEKAFELAAFDFITDAEWENNTLNLPALFRARINLLAQKSHIAVDRLTDWVLARFVLGAAWTLEDNGDPHQFMRPLIFYSC